MVMNSFTAGSLTYPPPPIWIGSPLACAPFHTFSLTAAVGMVEICHLSGIPPSHRNVLVCPTVRENVHTSKSGSSDVSGTSRERFCLYERLGAEISASDSAPDGICSGFSVGIVRASQLIPTPVCGIYLSDYEVVFLSICLCLDYLNSGGG